MNELAVNEPNVIDLSFLAFENLHSAYIISLVMSVRLYMKRMS